MYLSGSMPTYSSRLHQLTTNVNDLITGFIPEVRNYTGIVPKYQNINWNKEINSNWYQTTRIGMSTGRWTY